VRRRMRLQRVRKQVDDCAELAAGEGH
jgi:hypothetical protein